MAKAVNVKNASSGKAVVVKIEGGGGGGGDVKVVSFAEAINDSMYTLTNAADVLDMLEDVVTAEPYPMDAAVKYKVAFQKYIDLDGFIRYTANAWLEYDSFPGEPPFVSVASDGMSALIAAGVVDGQVLFGVNPGGGMVILTREDIDPTTGILTKDFSEE